MVHKSWDSAAFWREQVPEDPAQAEKYYNEVGGPQTEPHVPYTVVIQAEMPIGGLVLRDPEGAVYTVVKRHG